MIEITAIETQLQNLQNCLRQIGALTVAVSGGVDSMALAYIAHRTLPGQVQMLHAVSPAVPPQATSRVKEYAGQENWSLQIINAGEFSDSQYMANPANRCFFCKTNLYGTMAELSSGVLVSGTNSDDLGDYRPGLQAAQNHAVRHPYVEASIDKQGVRALAHYFALNDLAELPSAPCLSSRIETGIRIDPATLQVVNQVEVSLRTALQPQTVRCRVRSDTVCIELDQQSLAALAGDKQQDWQQRIQAQFQAIGVAKPVQFQSYRQGSAFLLQEKHG